MAEERRRHVQAIPALGISARQWHRSQRSTGSWASIDGQLKAIRPPPPVSAVCWATLSGQSPPWLPEPSFPARLRWPEPFGLPHHDKVTGPGFS